MRTIFCHITGGREIRLFVLVGTVPENVLVEVLIILNITLNKCRDAYNLRHVLVFLGQRGQK